MLGWSAFYTVEFCRPLSHIRTCIAGRIQHYIDNGWGNWNPYVGQRKPAQNRKV